MFPLPKRERILIIVLKIYGFTNGEIASMVSCSKPYVQKWIKRFIESMCLDTNYKGTLRVTTRDEDELILLKAHERPFITLRDIRRDLDFCSYWTIRNRLKEFGVKSYVCAKKTLLDQRRKTLRLRFCQGMQYFESWNRTIFVDESHFVSTRRGPKRILRERGARYAQENLNHINTSPRYTVSVFGMITWFGFGPLIRIIGTNDSVQYCDILTRCLPFIQFKFPHDDYFFTQDNVPIHVSNYTLSFIRDNFRGTIIDHPPFSPDLNPIENVWGTIKEYLKFTSKPNSSDKLFDQVLSQWNQLKNNYAYIQSLYSSMPNRIATCLNQSGGVTRY